MISSKLVRHPPPYPTESLRGYVLRLSEANGYTSPQSLYRLAGMRADETSPSNFECSKLAAIANCPTSLLDQIAFKDSGDESETMQLLGNWVSTRDLNLTGARVCPACVAEKGFIEAHWHIELMVACPVHERPAVWFCGKCRRRLSWVRSGLLTCKCGGSLLTSPRDSYSRQELWLLDLIRQKVLNDRTGPRNDSCMPCEQLAAMSLQSLLSLVRSLGWQRLTANRSSKLQMGRHLLQAAVSVLTDWPSNFEKLLRDIGPRGSEDGLTAPAANFANIYELVSGRIASRLQGHSSVTK